MSEIGPLWSSRQNRGPMVRPLSTAEAAALFVSLLEDLERKEVLQEALGKDCLDNPDLHGTLGSHPREKLLLETGRDNLFPVREHAGSWDEDTLLDAVELYGSLVSTGDPQRDDSYHHDYGQCGWHYGGFDREPAFSEYRASVSKMLVRYGPGFTLNAEGQVDRLVEVALDELTEVPSDSAPLEGDDEALVQGAIAKFRRRDLSSRRDAVRDLADVLERLRIVARGLMFKKDEGALFEIANGFWIRHNKPDQAREYDHDIWWDWYFHVALSSIRLIQALQARQPASTAQVDALVRDLATMTWRKRLLAERLADIGLSHLSVDDQGRIGTAVGHRCVGETVVVIRDGLDACATNASLDTWPAAYREALVEALFVDAAGDIATQPSLMVMAVRVLRPVPGADEIVESIAERFGPRMFSATFGQRERPRVQAAEQLRAAVAQLPAGRQRDAWLQVAGRIEEVF